MEMRLWRSTSSSPTKDRTRAAAAIRLDVGRRFYPMSRALQIMP
jgi:hypothetical protein